MSAPRGVQLVVKILCIPPKILDCRVLLVFFPRWQFRCHLCVCVCVWQRDVVRVAARGSAWVVVVGGGQDAGGKSFCSHQSLSLLIQLQESTASNHHHHITREAWATGAVSVHRFLQKIKTLPGYVHFLAVFHALDVDQHSQRKFQYHRHAFLKSWEYLPLQLS